MVEIEKRFWTKRKVVAIALILIVIGTVIIAALYITQEEPQISIPFLQHYPQLRVSLYQSGGEWKRDAITDLPIFETTIKYAVYNHGEVNAANVTINIFLDGSTHLSQSLPVLTPYETYDDEFSLTLTYDSSRLVVVEAFCADSSDSDTLIVKATLPRWPLGTVRQLYVTPYDQFVVNTLDYILKSKPPTVSNLLHIRQWVADHVEYRDDDDVHGTEFWQLPRETLQWGTGDCEDFAILLCSLLRADGWGAESVYVVLGEKDGQYHAWVKRDIAFPFGWENIEPQAGAWNIIIGDFLTLSGYKAKYDFNDVYYIYVS